MIKLDTGLHRFQIASPVKENPNYGDGPRIHLPEVVNGFKSRLEAEEAEEAYVKRVNAIVHRWKVDTAALFIKKKLTVRDLEEFLNGVLT